MCFIVEGGKTIRSVPRIVPLVFLGWMLLLLGCAEDKLERRPLPVPDALSIEAGNGKVTLRWGEAVGATGYNVYWGRAPGVSKATGCCVANATSPFTHGDLTNGLTHCYVVTARFGRFESAESPEVAAVPLPPAPGVPQGVSAAVAPEQPNAILIEWSPVPEVTSYRLYWNNIGNVTTNDEVVFDAMSPLLHSGLAGGTPHYYAVSSVGLGGESALSAEVMATPRGPAVPHGGDEGFGNNLSYPVVFADGYGVTGLPLSGTEDPWLDFNTGLRPGATELTPDSPFPFFDPLTVYVYNEVDHYEQKTASTWQASWIDAVGQDLDVMVEWGDNLWAQHFTTNSVVRIETILYQTAADPVTTSTEFSEVMTAYQMALLYGSGSTEQQGTNTVEYPAPTRHVFSVLGRLTIRKLQYENGPIDESVPAIDKAVWEGFGTDGPGGYGAEVNVGGKVVYGYVWMLNQSDLTPAQKAGWWRVTFSLDDSGSIGGTPIANQIRMIGLDPSDAAAAVLADPQTTYMDIHVELK